MSHFFVSHWRRQTEANSRSLGERQNKKMRSSVCACASVLHRNKRVRSATETRQRTTMETLNDLLADCGRAVLASFDFLLLYGVTYIQ